MKLGDKSGSEDDRNSTKSSLERFSATSNIPVTRGKYGKYVVSTLKNDTCRRLGVLSKGLETLTEFPSLETDFDALHLDDEELSYEITCKNVQERPPFHSINNIRQSFLPCLMEIHDENEHFKLQSVHRLAYVLSKQYKTWKQRCEEAVSHLSFQYSDYYIQEFKNFCLSDSDIIKDLLCLQDTIPKKQRRSGGVYSTNYKKSKLKSVLGIFEEYPFGPINLFSSSCIHNVPISNQVYLLTALSSYLIS